MEIREIIRRLRSGQSDRTIARALGINRKTIARYRVWATEQDLLTGPLPAVEALHQLVQETMSNTPPPQNISTVEPYRDLVQKLRQEGVEMAAIHERLKERGYTGSYSSVYRFVRRLEPRTPEVTVRVETPPGEEAQVDFGYAGRMTDSDTGKARRTWAFVMTLSWSRHQYVEFVFDQKVATWLCCHRNAFAFFDGVPERVVIDNLKAGVARICCNEPEAQRAYAECADHYDFFISPCQPRTPEHKGKVEQGGVHYVKRNFLGGREPTTIAQANQDVLRWVNDTAGQRIHGTTKEKPLDRFATERTALRPLPGTPYDMAVWKHVKLHRDCYLIFEQAYYSAPFRLVGQQLWVRGGTQTVQIYTDDYRLVATHDRAHEPGQRQTHPDHLPPHKMPGLTLTRESCRLRATEIGAATLQVVEDMLSHRPEDRLRTAGRLLRLKERFGATRLEAACARALRFDDPAYLTVKRILEQGLDMEPSVPTASTPPASAFVRSTTELVGHLQVGATWN
jgi:transposase